MKPAIRSAAERIVGGRFTSVTQMPRRAIPVSQVCAVTAADGSRFAVKYALHPAAGGGRADPIATEWAALTALTEGACRVPTPVGYDGDARVFVTEWVDGPTVDDACQAGTGVTVEDVSACLRELHGIHERCELGRRELAAYVTPKDDRRLEEEFAASFARARKAYYACLHASEPLNAATVERCDASWARLWDGLTPHSTRLSSDDVNARNIILASTGPVYLDFSSLGFDWIERRAACYLTSLGRNHATGRVACALSAEALEACGYAEPFALRVEGHVFVLACLAIAGMLTEGSGGSMPMWMRDDARAASVRRLLARGTVADLPATAALRGEAAAALGMQG